MLPATPDVIGRYQVLRYLGGGGMGVLYLAQDPAIDRLVAIKLLREGYDNPELRDRFMREARSAGRLHHSHVVTIFDVGEHQGGPFIAMEYIEGSTLDDLIRKREPLPLDRKMELMEALFSGLQYAHRNGVIHRDIKPANLMIDAEGTLKILDFGIARLGAAGMTQAGVVMGTLNYISPEQLRGETIDGRADLFSAGAVFYELLSGRRAFPGDLQSGILHKILGGDPEPVDQIVPGLDPGVVAFVNRCLEKDPTRRFPDMAAARRDLAAIRSQLGHSSATDPPTPAPTARPSVTTPRPHREALFRIRTEQIDQHLSAARQGFASGNYDIALEACHRALVLDPELEPALELEEQARTALEARQIEQWLAEARGELERGDLTSASVRIERALSLNSASPEARDLREAVDAARRQLAAAVPAAVATAGGARVPPRLKVGDPDGAVTPTDGTVVLDTNGTEISSRDLAAFVPPPVATPTVPLPRARSTNAPHTPMSPAAAAIRRPRYLAIGAAAALVSLVTWLLIPSGRAPGSAAVPLQATVVITVAPWATIQALTDRNDQRTIDLPDATTPLVLSLPPGDYRARAANPNFGRPIEFDFTVSADGAPVEIHQTMPDFQADDEIDRILSGR